MTILFLTTHLNTGGITQYLYVLSQGFRQRGHRVVLLSGGGECEEGFRDLGVHVVCMNLKTKSELSWRLHTAWPRIPALLDRYHVDVMHAQTRVTQVAATLVRRVRPVPVVTTCHGFFRPRWFRRHFPCWGEKVIAISPAVRDHLQKDFNVPSGRIALIPHGVDLDLYPPPDAGRRSALRGRYGLGQEPVIGIVARLSDVKGHDVLIRAMTRVRDKVPGVKLLIFGTGKTEPRLKRMVADLSLTGTVDFYPETGNMADVLPVFDLFVMPSRQEGLGLAVMEAMASRLPVVASKVGGLTALVEPGVTGYLVEPESDEQLAEACLALLADTARRRQFGQAGHDKVAREFSQAEMIEKTLDCYCEVVA